MEGELSCQGGGYAPQPGLGGVGQDRNMEEEASATTLSFLVVVVVVVVVVLV